jgi:hypothetical protein
MNIPTMIPVESSQISEIGHDPATETLFVQFKRGGLYSYANVPATKHARFVASESKGKFLGAEIKPHHAFTKQESFRK